MLSLFVPFPPLITEVHLNICKTLQNSHFDWLNTACIKMPLCGIIRLLPCVPVKHTHQWSCYDYKTSASGIQRRNDMKGQKDKTNCHAQYLGTNFGNKTRKQRILLKCTVSVPLWKEDAKFRIAKFREIVEASLA